MAFRSPVPPLLGLAVQGAYPSEEGGTSATGHGGSPPGHRDRQGLPRREADNDARPRRHMAAPAATEYRPRSQAEGCGSKRLVVVCLSQDAPPYGAVGLAFQGQHQTGS